MSPVTVFSDGPRTASDANEVEAVRRLLARRLAGKAEVVERDSNWGLSRNIIEGVTRLCESHGRVIVIEDDVWVAPTFLTYINAALDRYSSDDRVSSITGLSFDYPPGNHRSHFLPLISSWGWATWQRAWRRFDPEAIGWQELITDRGLRHRFDLDGAYGFSAMLLRYILGRNQSWAIRWYWSVFKYGGLTLFPSASLVSNIGLDGSGTHGRGGWRDFRIVADLTVRSEQLIAGLPQTVELDKNDISRVRKALLRRNGGAMVRIVDNSRALLVRISARLIDRA